ncbi:Hypothetical predicted protein, partial [Mytilus galloprovincialis]
KGYVYVEIDQYRGDSLLDPCHRKPCQSAEICEIKLDGNTFCVKDKPITTTTKDNTKFLNTGTSKTQMKTLTSISRIASTTEAAKIVTFDTTAGIPLTTTKSTIVSETHGSKSYKTTPTTATTLLETTAYKSSVSPITHDQPMGFADTIASSMAPTKTFTSLSDIQTIASNTDDTTVTDTSIDTDAFAAAENIELISKYITTGITTKTIDKTDDILLTNTKGTTVSETHRRTSDDANLQVATTLLDTTAEQASVSLITDIRLMETTNTIVSSVTPIKTSAFISESHTIGFLTIDEAPVTTAKTIELTSIYNTSGTTADIQLTNTEGTTASETQEPTFDEATYTATSTLLETTAAKASSSPINYDKQNEMTDTIARSATQTKTPAFISESQTISFTTDGSTLTDAITDKDTSTVTSADTIKLTSISTTGGTTTNTVGTSAQQPLIKAESTTVFETHGSTSDEVTRTSASTLYKTTTQASNSPITNETKKIASTTNPGSTPPFISDTQTIGTKTNDTTGTAAITDGGTVTAAETFQLTSLSSNTVTSTKTVGTTADTPLTNTEGTFTVSKTHKSPSDETTHRAAANLLETTADQSSVSQITNNKLTETTETIARPETPTQTSTSISDSMAIGFTTDDTTATDTTTSETTVTAAKTIEPTSSSNIVGTTTTTVGTTAEKRLIDTDGTTTVSETHGSPFDDTAHTAAISLMETTADQASSSPITYDEPRKILNTITHSATPTKTAATISESQTTDFTTDGSTVTDAIPDEDAVTAAETIKRTSISYNVGTTTHIVGISVEKPLINTEGTTFFETHGSKSDETTRTVTTTAQQASYSPPTYTKLRETTETVVGSKTQTKTPAFISNTQPIGSRTNDTTMTDTTIREVSVTAVKTIKLSSISNTIGTTEETPLINTEGTTTVSETHELASDATTHTAATTLLETTIEQALVSPTTNNKLREMTETIASTAMPIKTPAFISSSLTIGTTTDETTMTATTIREAIVTSAKPIELTSISYAVDTTTNTITTPLTNTKGTTVSETQGPTFDKNTHTAAITLLEITSDQVSNSPITNDNTTKTLDTIASTVNTVKTPASISDTETIGTSINDTTLTDATTDENTVTTTKHMSLNIGTSTKTISTTAEIQLTNTESTYFVSETRGPPPDETTHTAATNLLETTTDQSTVSSITNYKWTKTMEPSARPETPTKTSTSISDTSIGFAKEDTTATDTTTSEAIDTDLNTIQLTSMSNTAGITTKIVGSITDKHLTNTEGTTTLSETHEQTSDETFFTAAATLLKTTADQTSVSPITNDKPSQTTETISSSITSTSIFDTRTIGFTTDDTPMTDTITSEATVTAAQTIKLTSMSNTVGTTTRNIGTTSITDNYLTNTQGTTSVSEIHGPISDETTYTAAITLLKTTADQASISPITINKLTETTETIASSKTPTKTSTSISDTQTIGFKTDDTTMIEKTTSDATDTPAKTIQLTSMSNTVGTTTRNIGTTSITDNYLTNTQGTTSVSEIHGPISDETTYTAVITLLKTTADQASVSPITINKPTETTETIASSKTPTKTSTSISDTQTIGFKTDDTTMIEKNN